MQFSSLALPLLFVFLAGAIGQLWMCLIASISLWRLPASAHWTERARRGWSFRQVIGWGPLLLGVLTLVSGVLGKLPGRSSALFYFAAAFGAIVAGAAGMRWYVRRRYSFADRLGDFVFAFLVRAPALPFLLLTTVLLVGRDMDAGSIAIMAGGLGLAFAATLGLFMPALRRVGLLRPGGERLERVMQRASVEAGLAPPPVYRLRWTWANAMAFIHAHAVAFTDPMVALLNDDELVAVALHEIAHLTETPRQKLVRLSGLLFSFPVFTSPLWLARFGLAGLLVPLGLFVFGQRFLVQFARKMEHRADAAAHGAARESTLATALEKAYEFNLVPAVMQGKRRIHPHLYDRMTAAGLQPAYPRPKPPGSALAVLGMISLLVFVPMVIALNPQFPGLPAHKHFKHSGSHR